MSIFGIIGISFFCAALLCIIFTIVPLVDDGFNGDEEKENKHLLFSLFFCIAIFVAGIFLGIGITTEEERVYVQKYLATADWTPAHPMKFLYVHILPAERYFQ